MTDIAYDIFQAAIDVTEGEVVTAGLQLKISKALHEERNRNLAEVQAWRDRWRVAAFSLDADAAVADDCRRYMKMLFGTTSTFVDDDLRILAHLADQAIAAGLTGGLPESLRQALEEKRLADRERPLDPEDL